MVTIGYALAADSQRPAALLADARRAETAGFSYAVLAEPDQSWIEHHGTSSFVWTMLAGLVPVTTRLEIVTGSTNKGLTVRTAQQHGQHYVPRLLEHAARGELDPTYLVTHRMPLDQGPRGYEMFKHKEDGCVRVVFAP